jgi:cobalt-zinc-cadmium efflux system protein
MVAHPHLPQVQVDAPKGAARRLLSTSLVTGTIMLAEAVGGAMSGSLSLLADAGHMLTDLLAIGVAYAALRFAERPADDQRTYGYRRLEVLAALLNGMALVGVSGSILIEGIGRLRHPQPVEVLTMIGVASVGLLANLIGLALLGHGHTNLNMRGAFLHIVGDTLSSVGVVVGGAIIYFTGWTRLDALLSIGISLIIVVTSFRLLRDVVDVLLEAAPQGLQTDAVRQALVSLPCVAHVHDLHVWSITHGLPALSAHVVMQQPQDDPHHVLCQVQEMLRKRFAIAHVTLQIERVSQENNGCTLV